MVEVLVVAGLVLLVVSCAIVVWLIRLYEARIAALEAQLGVRCPTCQAGVHGEKSSFLSDG
jgi:hypothetical protein